jgi:hypothetical protein
MGGTFSNAAGAKKPTFIIEAMQDATPIAAIDLIKLQQVKGQVKQQVINLKRYPKGQASSCVIWTDNDFESGDIALWYVRVLEQPTLRWDQKKQIQERAWSSPIWSGAIPE